MERSFVPSARTASPFRASCARTTAPACAASRNMRVEPGSRGMLFTRRTELRDEIIGVAAKERLAEFDRLPVAKEADALDEQPRIALVGVQQLRLLGVQQQRAQ